MEIEKAKNNHKKDVNSWHHDKLLEKCVEYDKQEAIKMKQLDEKRKLTQQVLQDQHEVFKRKHIEILQEEILEGELIKRKAIEANAKAKMEEDKKRYCINFVISLLNFFRIGLCDAQRE